MVCQSDRFNPQTLVSTWYFVNAYLFLDILLQLNLFLFNLLTFMQLKFIKSICFGNTLIILVALTEMGWGFLIPSMLCTVLDQERRG